MGLLGKRKKQKARKKQQRFVQAAKKVARMCALVCTVLAIIGALVFGGRLLLHSERLHIKNIILPPEHRLQGTQTVLNQNGIYIGNNILLADLDRASKQLERHSWIYRAVIKRKLPHTIVINIQQREPVAVILCEERYLVDVHSEVFAKAPSEAKNLPIIKGFTKAAMVKGDTETKDLIRAAVTLVTELRKQQMLESDNVTVVVSPVFGLTLEAAPGKLVAHMGFDDLAKKLTVLKKVRADLDQKRLKARTINLTSLAKAYVTLET